jgi:glycine oxidase
MTNFDYIVIGGGIIGMTTARELAVRGASVALIEKGELGKEASWAAGGILSSMRPWTENPASAELSEHGKIFYPRYINSLIDETGIDPEYVKSGLIVIEARHIADVKHWAISKCIKVKDKIENLNPDIKLPEQAVLLPEISQLRPPRLLKALRKSLELLSVSVFENTDITNLVTSCGRCEQVEFNGGKLSAESVIITSGAWSKMVLGDRADGVNIKPIHGQMMCVKPTESLLKSIILDGGHYLIPRLDGHVLIGSTMEDIGFNKETTMTAQEELRDWAASVWPLLKDASLVKHWSGLRPSTNTEKPFIGLVPDFKNLYFNTGHFRKGILQAPSSALLLADILSGESSFMDIGEFTLHRQTNEAEIVR